MDLKRRDRSAIHPMPFAVVIKVEQSASSSLDSQPKQIPIHTSLLFSSLLFSLLFAFIISFNFCFFSFKLFPFVIWWCSYTLDMAVELMSGYRSDGFVAKMEEKAVQEAAAAGLQSVENLIKLLGQQQYQSSSNPNNSSESNSDYRAVADVAVNKFKKFISLLDRSRTGHARFRRGPVPNNPPPTSQQLHTQPQPQPQPQPQQQQEKYVKELAPLVHHLQTVEKEMVSGGSSRVYCPTPIQRLPPIPQHHVHQQLVRTTSIDRKEPMTTINFAAAAVSPANSFMSSLTGDTDSLQPSMSSGFQITNMSQVSSAGRPPLSSSSFKRKCSSMDDSHGKCANSSGRCHCSKKR